MAVVCASDGVTLDDSALGEYEHFEVDLVSVPACFQEVGDLSLFHELSPVLLAG